MSIPKQTIDHSKIDQFTLLQAQLDQSQDQSSKIYPWVGDYPLTGQPVVCDGVLWKVREVSGPNLGARLEGRAIDPTDILTLVRVSPRCVYAKDASLLAYRRELRPVTWTQADEDALHASWVTCGTKDTPPCP